MEYNEANPTLVDPAFAATWPTPLTYTLASLDLASIPEPTATIGLLTLGILGIGSVFRRKL